MKETFIIRTEWYASISELTPQEQAIIFKNLFEYHLGNLENIVTPTLPVKLVWNLIEPNMKRNIERYDRRCETSAENGKLGGRPKKEETPEEKPNQEPNKPNEKPNNPDSESVSDSEPEKKEKKEKKKVEEVNKIPFQDTMLNLTWQEWIAFRKERKTPLTPIGANRQIKFLSKYHPKVAEAIIDKSIQNDWKGLFEPDNKMNVIPMTGQKKMVL